MLVAMATYARDLCTRENSGVCGAVSLQRHPRKWKQGRKPRKIIHEKDFKSKGHSSQQISDFIL